MYVMSDDRGSWAYQNDRMYHLMFNHACECKRKMASICHPLFSTDMAKALAYAFQNEDEHALNVCEYLQIGPLEMSAVIEDFEWFKEELIQKDQDAALSAAEIYEV